MVDKYEKAYRMGLMSKQERYEKIIEIWNKATDDVADALMESLGTLNNLYIMATFGSQRKQEPDQTGRRYERSDGQRHR